MSGPIYGKLECYTNTGYMHTIAQEVFKGLYDFFVYLETQSVVSIVSSYRGDSGTGFDYWDGANQLRSNAWFLAKWLTNTSTPSNPSYAGPRTNCMYMFFQFFRGDQSALGAAGNGSPALLYGTTQSGNTCGIGTHLAIGVGGTGDSDPWNGTLALGTGAKGTPVWKDPSGGGTGHFVFPRSNSGTAGNGTGGAGSFITDQQNLCPVWFRSGFNTTQCRYHFIADYDSFLMLSDNNDNIFYPFYQGIYTPRAGLTTSYPYIQFNMPLPVNMGTGNIYGSYAGNATYEGGIAYYTYPPLAEVRGMVLSRMDEALGFSGSQIQPNRLFASNTYDEMPILVGVYDYFAGYAGAIPFFREVQNVANLEQTADLKKLIVGTAAVSSIKLIVPWNSGVSPGSGLTRAGTTGVFP